ncbi:MAG: peptide ABC transporter substrate-binding protein [Proteobacteria bacterium]|nr:peptide ABC transporter substrate-binding protein [Pseudomonadota bacterium]
MLRQFARLVLAAAFCAGAAASPRAGSPETAAAKETLTIGITQFPSTFNPNIDAMLAKSYILAMTRRPVTAYDKDWRLVCMLCTELPTFENGRAWLEDLADGGTGIALRVTLETEARWGDGRPVTSADAVFTWQVGRHPESGVSDMEAYRRILDIEVEDDKTFVLHVDRVTFDYNDLGLDILPAHLERAAFAEPREYKNRTTFDTDTTNPGLYFGPYRITQVVSGSHVVLEPNPTWWGPPPHFRRIVVRVIENTAALEANLLSGAIDYIAGELGLSLDQALAFEKRHGEDYNVVYRPGLIYEHIDLNLDNPILADRRVRQALVYGLDRQAISDQLFEGRQPVAHTNVNPLDWVYADDIQTYAYDPEKAAELLDQAGWTAFKDGIRHNAGGERLTLELMTTAGNRSRELVEQVLQSQWRQLGIDIRIRNEPARVFFGRTVRERRFTGLAMFAWISSPEGVPRTTLHSDQIPTPENNFAGQNYTGFRDAEMDALIDRIEVELDRAARRRMWHRLQQIYAEALPVIPLYFRANAYILPKWLAGVEPTGHQYTSTLWVENWRAVP